MALLACEAGAGRQRPQPPSTHESGVSLEAVQRAIDSCEL
jgi:hypothetical protein